MSLFATPWIGSLPGSFVHGISQAWILEWVAISSSREYSQTRERTWISGIGRHTLYHWATRETLIIKTELGYLPEKAMAPHSSTLAWKIPLTEEPGRLRSMGSLRVRHNWVTSLSLFTFMDWRRKWQPTPVFLPGKSQGRGSLVGCHLWGCTESGMTEVT